jgi:GT2 family glycosyltransferase
MTHLAPIIVFAYNRPDHLGRTLHALANNDLASESILYVFCDGAREWGGEIASTDQNGNYITKRYGMMYCTESEYNTYLKSIQDTRDIARNQKGFKELYVIERETNVGLAANIIDAITQVVNQYGRVIAFEDDIETTRGCLTYLNDALELYKDDKLVMHISAWMYPNKGQFPTTLFYDSPYPAGGWATWKRAWQYFNPNTEDHVRYWQNNWKEFDIMGEDHLSRQMLGNLNGTLKTWYVKWYSTMRRMNGLCLYPGTAMSNNIGWDDSGETSQANTRYNIVNPTEFTKVERIPIKRNRKAFNYIRVWYSGHWYSRRYRVRLYNKIRKILGLQSIK